SGRRRRGDGARGGGVPAVVAQRGRQRVAADQVVAARVGARDVAAAIARDDRVGQRGRAGVSDEQAAAVRGGVAADSAIGQRGRAVGDEQAAATVNAVGAGGV